MMDQPTMNNVYACMEAKPIIYNFHIYTLEVEKRKGAVLLWKLQAILQLANIYGIMDFLIISSSIKVHIWNRGFEMAVKWINFSFKNY